MKLIAIALAAQIMIPEVPTGTTAETWHDAYQIERTARILWRERALERGEWVKHLSTRLDISSFRLDECREHLSDAMKPTPPEDATPWWVWPLVAVGAAGAFVGGFAVGNALQ